MAIFDLHHPWSFTFGILGNIVSIFVYLAPLPTFIRICKRKSTLGFQSLPYVVALFSAMLWMYYAFLKKNAFLLVSINSVGCLIETIYIVIYLVYASNDARRQTAKLVASLNVGLFCVIFLLTSFLLKTSIRFMVVGWICVAMTVIVFAAPLSIVFQVVRTRSVEFMPFTLSFFLTLSAVLWLAYGLLQKDLCIALPNILGFFLGMLQMLLYGLYRNEKRVVEAEKKMVAELIINIGGPSEVHPLDSRTTIEDVPIAAATTEDENKQEKEEEEEERVGKSMALPSPNHEPNTPINVQLDTPSVLILCAA